MTTEQAFEAHTAMRRHGIPGTVTPVTPGDPDSQWLVVDATGDDITAQVLASLAAASARRPSRGFVVTR